MEQTQQLIRGIKKGLLNWYHFKPGSIVLYIGDKEDALAEVLSGHLHHMEYSQNGEDKLYSVVCATVAQTRDCIWRQDYIGCFDYLISVEDLELELDPAQVLKEWKSLMKPTGTMLLGMNNRFGIRYFCGDRDIYTNRNFDGIEGYQRAYVKREDTFLGRTYSMAELKEMLGDTGWHSYKFYSVFSDLKYPTLIFAEDYLPNEDLANRVKPMYHYPSSVFLEEESLYGSLIENNMFHQMANAYLIECSLNGVFSDVSHVTASMPRGEKYALYTIMHGTDSVEKVAAYPEGMRQLEQIVENLKELKERGIFVIDGKLEQGHYIMSYMKEEIAQLYLKRLLLKDRERFLQEMDRFRDTILRSSEIIQEDFGDGKGAILKKGYPDMVPLNCFYINGEYVFYDQEFCVENYPANAIIFRMIATFYGGSPELYKILPMDQMFDRYHLSENLEEWQRLEWELIEKVKNEHVLRNYYEKRRRNYELVNSNRQRMNYSTEEYRRLFEDIFVNADTRKLILFGSGNFAKKFLSLYANDYPVYAILDNNEAKWGQELEGVIIQSPELLQKMNYGEYKVIICIKNYLSIMKQLESMGVTDYSIYDSHKDYPRIRKPIIQIGDIAEDKSPKKYHVGYVAGVFDLFHIGHLNMFKRAKEQCDYLIVGVVTDEGVRKFKKTENFIPFEERIEIVRSCRYVDEAVEIPLNYGGIRDAYRLHHFDVQFSGSDYADNEDWLADREFLRENGADMVFFPYTEQTSSTKIKALIMERLS